MQDAWIWERRRHLTHGHRYRDLAEEEGIYSFERILGIETCDAGANAKIFNMTVVVNKILAEIKKR